MKTHNPENERIKRAYFTYLAEAVGSSEATLDGVAKALNRFETYTKFRDFKAFHIDQVGARTPPRSRRLRAAPPRAGVARRLEGRRASMTRLR